MYDFISIPNNLTLSFFNTRKNHNEDEETKRLINTEKRSKTKIKRIINYILHIICLYIYYYNFDILWFDFMQHKEK